MALYKKVLMALDFHNDNSQIIDKGEQVARENGAELFLVHVDEPIAVAYATNGMGFSDQIVSLQASIRKEAQQKMHEVGERLEVAESNRLIREGNPAAEIHAVAEEHDIDLIIIGTHGQSGLQLLLGSTANSVLHGVSCDVLAVRIREP